MNVDRALLKVPTYSTLSATDADGRFWHFVDISVTLRVRPLLTTKPT